MKSVIWSIIGAFVLSFLFSSAWFILFGYNPIKSLLENFLLLITNRYFWNGVVIWTGLFLMFVTFPVAFLKGRPNNI